MPCEMCGKEKQLFKADIEGAVLTVCKGCAKFGKIISVMPLSEKKKDSKDSKSESAEKKPLERLKKEIIQVIAEDYAQKVKDAREKSGLKQQELARMMAERESLIHNVESGQFIPGIALARKFEKHLKIKLIEQHEESFEEKKRAKSSILTLGDMISLKK